MQPGGCGPGGVSTPPWCCLPPLPMAQHHVSIFPKSSLKCCSLRRLVGSCWPAGVDSCLSGPGPCHPASLPARPWSGKGAGVTSCGSHSWTVTAQEILALPDKAKGRGPGCSMQGRGCWECLRLLVSGLWSGSICSLGHGQHLCPGHVLHGSELFPHVCVISTLQPSLVPRPLPNPGLRGAKGPGGAGAPLRLGAARSPEPQRPRQGAWGQGG